MEYNEVISIRKHPWEHESNIEALSFRNFKKKTLEIWSTEKVIALPQVIWKHNELETEHMSLDIVTLI